MKSITLPYGIRFRADSRIEVFPAAEISLLGRRGKSIRALFHIDSGATTSAIPAGDAVALGFDPREGKRMVIRGIGGIALEGHLHVIRIRIGEIMLRAPIVVANQPDIPRVLGREGIFTRFLIVFDEKKRRSGFIGTVSKEARTIRKVLDT